MADINIIFEHQTYDFSTFCSFSTSVNSDPWDHVHRYEIMELTVTNTGRTNAVQHKVQRIYNVSLGRAPARISHGTRWEKFSENDHKIAQKLPLRPTDNNNCG
jgi:hypothetical protein